MKLDAGARSPRRSGPRSSPRASPGSPRARDDRLRREPAPGDLFFGLRGERVDGGEFAAGGDRGRRLGRRSSTRSRSHLSRIAAKATRAAGLGLRRRRSAGGAAGAGPRLAARARRPRRRRHRLGRQDLGQGHRPGAAAGPGPRQPREPQHRDRAAADRARSARRHRRRWCWRWRCAAPARSPSWRRSPSPRSAVITNVGPVHVELLGSVEAIAAAKAEILDGAAAPSGTAVVPVEAGELEPHLGAAPQPAALRPRRRRRGGRAAGRRGRHRGADRDPAGAPALPLPLRRGAQPRPTPWPRSPPGVALGAPLAEMADRAANIGFSRFRGERLELGDGIVLVNDCYNANPVSMRAALDHLAHARGRRARIAVLGEMAELGPGAAGYHREVGEHARAAGVDLLIGVGEPARDYDPDELVADPERGGRAARRPARARRRGPGQGLALGRPRGRRRDALGGAASDGRSPDRRDGGDADLHLPRPEVHRVPAGARSSASTSARTGRRSTTPRPARRRWAG